MTKSIFQTKIHIGFSFVEEKANTFLKSKVYEFAGQTIRAANVQIKGIGKKLKVDADLSGSFDGHLTLIGAPIFDMEKKAIALPNVDLDLRGNNFKSKTIALFLTKQIENKMEEFLHIPFQTLINLTNQQIQNANTSNDFAIQGQLEAMEIHDWKVYPEELEFGVTLNGDLSLRLGRKKTIV